MRVSFYIVVYSFLGWALERIINVVYYAEWYDNRVLHLWFQPMYGLGVVFTLIAYEKLQKYRIKKRTVFALTALIAILFTAMFEALSGYGYLYLFGEELWNYKEAFPFCQNPYVCIVPSSLFGLFSAYTVIYLHPNIEMWLAYIPKPIKVGLIVLLVGDFLVTYYGVIS